VTWSGIINTAESINVPLTRKETQTQSAIATGHEELSQIARKKSAVTSSTAKSRNEIFAPQFAQRPRSTTQLINGRFCCHGIGCLQFGQKDRRGRLIDRSTGHR